HGFRAGKAQIGLKAREAVGRKAGALLKKEADFIVPIYVIKRESDKAERFRGSGVQRLAHRPTSLVMGVRLAKKAPMQPAEAVAHRKHTGQIDVSQDDRCRRSVITLAAADQHIGTIGGEHDLGERADKAGTWLDERHKRA